MEMKTLYFHAECTHCNFVSETYDNETQGGIRTAQHAALKHLDKCDHPVNIYRDNELHSTADYWKGNKQ